jgi:alpha-L-arabinofuranosidase
MGNATITVHLDEPQARINRMLYGHFAEHLGACVNEGLWVGETSSIDNIGGLRRDMIEAMRQIRVPVLRWPGGCYADDYHWEDGIGPRRERPRRVNLWWGHTIEDNCFGTHEFLQLCRLVGCEAYLAGNLGSGSPREMREWVEYCNYPGDSTLARRRGQNGSPQPFNVRYWGVGNENWGCGGMYCPEGYASEYRRFANYLHDMGGTKLFLVACGPNGNDHDWTRRFFNRLGSLRRIHGFAAHYYTWNREGQFGTATEFNEAEWYGLLHRSLAADALIREQRALMDEFDPQRKIALFLDEWGAWHPAAPGTNPAFLYQQNALRDALVAAMTLDIFNRNADALHMANIAQTANVLQALFLTQGERLVLTPTFHVFDMYQSHQDGQGVRLSVEAGAIPVSTGGANAELPRLSGSASVADGRELTLSIVNTHATAAAEAAIDLRGGQWRSGELIELRHDAMNAHNTFDDPGQVTPARRTIEPPAQEWRHVFAPASVTVMRLRLG